MTPIEMILIPIIYTNLVMLLFWMRTNKRLKAIEEKPSVAKRGPAEWSQIYTACQMYFENRKNIERKIDLMLSGQAQSPDLYEDLQENIGMVQLACLKAQNNGVPEDRLALLRDYIWEASKRLTDLKLP